MSKQITSSILMIRPLHFSMNAETAVNNYYQKVIAGLSAEQAQAQALAEFDRFVEVLRTNGIEVIVVEDTPISETPDSIFPNNWLSLHHDGTFVLYPMFAENRRQERRSDIVDVLLEAKFSVSRIKDLSLFESQSKYLEGTGSMLLDRDNHLVYAALSQRTNIEVLEAFCEEFDYKKVVFTAMQTAHGERLPIYHTNVMMCITNKLAIVCLASIDEANERFALIQSLESTSKHIIEISEEQVNHFAGNMLALRNKAGDEFLIMSEAALSVLDVEQKQKIEKHYKIISSSLDTIEALGGGSARCMMAEIFLPKNI